jgi:formate dehydrogenase maturation protein FdhE
LFQLEKDEKDPDVLKDLASVALDVGREMEELLALLEEKIED